RNLQTKKLIEQDPLFADLMDWPGVFPIAKALIGRDITLSDGGYTDYRPARAPAFISWHNDFAWMRDVPYPLHNFWIRCTYFIEDVTEDMGPFTLLPRSHLSAGPCVGPFTDEKG